MPNAWLKMNILAHLRCSGELKLPNSGIILKIIYVSVMFVPVRLLFGTRSLNAVSVYLFIPAFSQEN